MDRSQIDDIRELVVRLIEPAGYECVDVEWVGNERILRVYVDRPGGINMDDCVAVTRELRDVEELDERISGAYNLEVSSPGVERPLRSRQHFEQFQGEVVRVKLTEKVADRKQGVGKIVGVSPEDVVTLETEEGTWQFPLVRLKKANLVYDWSQS